MNLDPLSDAQLREFETRVKGFMAAHSTSLWDAQRTVARRMKLESLERLRKLMRDASWSGFAVEPMKEMTNMMSLILASEDE